MDALLNVANYNININSCNLAFLFEICHPVRREKVNNIDFQFSLLLNFRLFSAQESIVRLFISNTFTKRHTFRTSYLFIPYFFLPISNRFFFFIYLHYHSYCHIDSYINTLRIRVPSPRNYYQNFSNPFATSNQTTISATQNHIRYK